MGLLRAGFWCIRYFIQRLQLLLHNEVQKKGSIHIVLVSILDHTHIQTYNLANNESQYTECKSAHFEAATNSMKK